jgi:hypothetical protein
MSTAGIDQSAGTGAHHRGRTFWNWTAAVLALVGSLAVVGFAYLKVLGTAACTDRACGDLGPSETVFGLVLYGTPIVGVVAVLLSFVTAKRSGGFIVPLIAWIVVAAALVVLVTTF